MITEARGAIGGIIFSRNGSCAYVKKYTVPVNPQTEKQLAVRAGFGQMSSDWNTITEAQRDAWNALASTLEFINSVGDVYTLSGKQYFQKVNSVTHSVNETPFADAPPDGVVPDAPAEIVIAGEMALGTLVLTSDETTVPTDRIYLIDAAPPTAAGKVNNNSLYKRCAMIDDGDSWSTYDFSDDYEALYGVFSLGQRIDCRFMSYDKNNGRLSPYIKAHCIITAT